MRQGDKYNKHRKLSESILTDVVTLKELTAVPSHWLLDNHIYKYHHIDPQYHAPPELKQIIQDIMCGNDTSERLEVQRNPFHFCSTSDPPELLSVFEGVLAKGNEQPY